ncbi:MAG TPA: hypothetical protein VFF75_06615 [Methylophilaceae bacterium]|nr:hypothetical protein [Methylophilaceae bacterium]
MFTKIVLCATSTHLTAGIWRLGKLQSFQIFQNKEQGYQDFKRFLEIHPHIPLYLLADDIEEDFRLETLPHTSGNARREIVERKLNQIYRGTIYRAAHFINREKEKRRDDRFLFIALNNPELVQGWMQVIEELQAPLVGLYLLPMVSQVIVKRLKLMAPHILLCERLSSGLRQTYLHNGRLRVSRLAPILPDSENKLGFFYVTETEKTRLYLISQRHITRDTALSVVMPSLDANSEQISRLVEQENGVDCTRVDLVQLANTLRLDAPLLQKTPELLHMHLLAIGNVPDNLAPSKQIKNSQLNMLRRGINLTSAIILLAGLLLASMYLKESFEFEQSTQQLASQTQVQENLYNEVAKDFPSTPIPSNDLKLAVELHQAIVGYAKSPERIMRVMSQAIENSPEIQINRLRWVRSNDIELKDTDQATVATPIPQASAQVQAGFVPDPTALYQVAFVNGEIRGFTGDYRAALSSVTQLVERLRANPEVEQVQILQEPVNVSSLTSLQGSTAEERTSQQTPALFKLKIILKRQGVPT